MPKKKKTGGQVSENTKIVLDYLKKYPSTPSRSLAKLIEKDFPYLYKTSETYYTTLRRLRGEMGAASKERSRNAGILVEKVQMPESFSETRTLFKIPITIKKLGVMGDQHIPYHDVRAIEVALDQFEKEEVDAIFLNGDLLDFYQLSSHEKDPRKARFKEEIEAGKQFFKYLRSRFPNIPIYFIPGNHENRFERFLRNKAAEFLGLDEFRLDVLLEVGAHRIEYIPFRTNILFGDLLIEHGDKIPGAGGVVPARTALMRFKRNIMVNHFHKTSTTTQRIFDVEKEVVIRGYSLGCLCELSPEYLEVNEWNHGFAILTRTGDQVAVSNYKIENGVIL